MRFNTTLILFLLLKSSLFAYEIDQFTRRDEIPKDSVATLDEEIQKRFQQALKQANSRSLIFKFKCNGNENDKKEARLRLFKSLNEQLTNVSPTDYIENPVGVIEKFVINNKQVQKRITPLEQSIYSQADPEILKNFGVESVINVNQIQIGADKLGHFFNDGYLLYFDNHSASTDFAKYTSGIKSSLRYEKGSYGLTTTGVFSYADVSANLAGQKFWEKICGNTNQSTTTEEKRFFETYQCKPDSYFQCDIKTGDWILNPKQKFSFKDYVTDAWDESINCSLYSEEIAETVFQAMTQRVYSYKGNPKQPCPAEPQKCIEFKKKYTSYEADLITSPVCKKIIKAHEKNIEIPKTDKFSYSFDNYQSGSDKKSEPGSKAKHIRAETKN